MHTQFFPAADRGIKDLGWLKSRLSFSFGEYRNPMTGSFGSLQVFNDDTVEAGKGFGLHPHVNMEIISVLLEGRMNHRDSLGYSTEIGEGGVQIMSAGSGLRHEEYNIGTTPVRFLQLWITPKLQHIQPRYQLRHFPKAQRKNRLTTIVSYEEGTAHCWINQNARLQLGYFDEVQTLEYTFNPVNKEVFAFAISGTVRVAGRSLSPGDALGVWDTDRFILETTPGAEFLLVETVINQK